MQGMQAAYPAYLRSSTLPSAFLSAPVLFFFFRAKISFLFSPSICPLSFLQSEWVPKGSTSFQAHRSSKSPAAPPSSSPPHGLDATKSFVPCHLLSDHYHRLLFLLSLPTTHNCVQHYLSSEGLVGSRHSYSMEERAALLCFQSGTVTRQVCNGLVLQSLVIDLHTYPRGQFRF